MKKHDSFLAWEMTFPLIGALLANLIAYNGTRIVTENFHHHNLTSYLDEEIPLIPWTVCIYLGCYLFWAINYIIGCKQDRDEAYRFISADFFAKTICFLIFLIFPTTTIRPHITGNSIWNSLMRNLYFMDAADNLFPSIHCLTSWFCYIAVRKNKNVSAWYRNLSLVFALMICISTLTTKQHILLDVFGGIGLAEFSYRIVGRTGFTSRYKNVILYIRKQFVKKRMGAFRE